MKRFQVVAFVAGALSLALLPAGAQERRPSGTWGSGATGGGARVQEKSPPSTRVTTREMTVIRDYYRTAPAPEASPPPAPVRKKKIPPGLRKKVERGGELPPGWQKKLARGEVMDQEVYAHSAPLPPDLVRRLPPQPAGTVIVTIEGKAVRLLVTTRAILDVFDLR